MLFFLTGIIYYNFKFVSIARATYHHQHLRSILPEKKNIAPHKSMQLTTGNIRKKKKSRNTHLSHVWEFHFVCVLVMK